MVAFKPDEAASLLTKRFRVLSIWWHKSTQISFCFVIYWVLRKIKRWLCIDIQNWTADCSGGGRDTRGV